MLQKITALATVCFAAVASAQQDPYTKYSSLHPIPATDIRGNNLTEVGIYTRNKTLTLVTNVASF